MKQAMKKSDRVFEVLCLTLTTPLISAEKTQIFSPACLQADHIQLLRPIPGDDVARAISQCQNGEHASETSVGNATESHPTEMLVNTHTVGGGLPRFAQTVVSFRGQY